MSQDKLTSEIFALERKLTLMVKEHQSLRKEYEDAQNENKDLRQQLKEKDQELGRFRNQVKINKIAGNIDSEGESTEEIKQKVNEYIKEIDKCILHLSR